MPEAAHANLNAEPSAPGAAAARTPIDVVLGTKAQYIKTAPVLRELDRRGVPYRLIDTGQHAGLAPSMRRDLAVNEPDVVLADNGNVATLGAAFIWAARIFGDILFRSRRIRETYFSKESEYCIIHGDTPSTLLSLLLAKRAGKKVVHLEAGLRSFNLFKPFPEEIIRILCMRFSDILFAPSTFAVKNLKDMNLKGEIFELAQNTNVEALFYSLENGGGDVPFREPYALFTVHRVETIFNQRRLAFAVKWVLQIAERMPVLFVMHDPTRKRLNGTELMTALEAAPNVRIAPLMSHARFARYLEGCAFAVTDGGSIQEEAYFLDKPCLILRTETERNEGLGGNARIGGFDDAVMKSFLAEYQSMTRGAREENKTPSRAIVDRLLAESPSRPL